MSEPKFATSSTTKKKVVTSTTTTTTTTKKDSNNTAGALAAKMKQEAHEAIAEYGPYFATWKNYFLGEYSNAIERVKRIPVASFGDHSDVIKVGETTCKACSLPIFGKCEKYACVTTGSKKQGTGGSLVFHDRCFKCTATCTGEPICGANVLFKNAKKEFELSCHMDSDRLPVCKGHIRPHSLDLPSFKPDTEKGEALDFFNRWGFVLIDTGLNDDEIQMHKRYILEIIGAMHGHSLEDMEDVVKGENWQTNFPWPGGDTGELAVLRKLNSAEYSAVNQGVTTWDLRKAAAPAFDMFFSATDNVTANMSPYIVLGKHSHMIGSGARSILHDKRLTNTTGDASSSSVADSGTADPDEEDNEDEGATDPKNEGGNGNSSNKGGKSKGKRRKVPLEIYSGVLSLTDSSDNVGIMVCPNQWTKTEGGQDNGELLEFQKLFDKCVPRAPTHGIYPEDFPLASLCVPISVKAGQLLVFKGDRMFSLKPGEDNFFGLVVGASNITPKESTTRSRIQMVQNATLDAKKYNHTQHRFPKDLQYFVPDTAVDVDKALAKIIIPFDAGTHLAKFADVICGSKRIKSNTWPSEYQITKTEFKPVDMEGVKPVARVNKPKGNAKTSTVKKEDPASGVDVPSSPVAVVQAETHHQEEEQEEEEQDPVAKKIAKLRKEKEEADEKRKKAVAAKKKTNASVVAATEGIEEQQLVSQESKKISKQVAKKTSVASMDSEDQQQQSQKKKKKSAPTQPKKVQQEDEEEEENDDDQFVVPIVQEEAVAAAAEEEEEDSSQQKKSAPSRTKKKKQTGLAYTHPFIADPENEEEIQTTKELPNIIRMKPEFWKDEDGSGDMNGSVTEGFSRALKPVRGRSFQITENQNFPETADVSFDSGASFSLFDFFSVSQAQDEFEGELREFAVEHSAKNRDKLPTGTLEPRIFSVFGRGTRYSNKKRDGETGPEVINQLMKLANQCLYTYHPDGEEIHTPFDQMRVFTLTSKKDNVPLIGITPDIREGSRFMILSVGASGRSIKIRGFPGADEAVEDDDDDEGNSASKKKRKEVILADVVACSGMGILFDDVFMDPSLKHNIEVLPTATKKKSGGEMNDEDEEDENRLPPTTIFIFTSSSNPTYLASGKNLDKKAKQAAASAKKKGAGDASTGKTISLPPGKKTFAEISLDFNNLCQPEEIRNLIRKDAKLKAKRTEFLKFAEMSKSGTQINFVLACSKSFGELYQMVTGEQWNDNSPNAAAAAASVPKVGGEKKKIPQSDQKKKQQQSSSSQKQRQSEVESGTEGKQKVALYDAPSIIKSHKTVVVGNSVVKRSARQKTVVAETKADIINKEHTKILQGNYKRHCQKLKKQGKRIPNFKQYCERFANAKDGTNISRDPTFGAVKKRNMNYKEADDGDSDFGDEDEDDASGEEFIARERSDDGDGSDSSSSNSDDDEDGNVFDGDRKRSEDKDCFEHFDLLCATLDAMYDCAKDLFEGKSKRLTRLYNEAYSSREMIENSQISDKTVAIFQVAVEELKAALVDYADKNPDADIPDEILGRTRKSKSIKQSFKSAADSKNPESDPQGDQARVETLRVLLETAIESGDAVTVEGWNPLVKLEVTTEFIQNLCNMLFKYTQKTMELVHFSDDDDAPSAAGGKSNTDSVIAKTLVLLEIFRKENIVSAKFSQKNMMDFNLLIPKFDKASDKQIQQLADRQNIDEAETAYTGGGGGGAAKRSKPSLSSSTSPSKKLKQDPETGNIVVVAGSPVHKDGGGEEEEEEDEGLLSPMDEGEDEGEGEDEDEDEEEGDEEEEEQQKEKVAPRKTQVQVMPTIDEDEGDYEEEEEEVAVATPADQEIPQNQQEGEEQEEEDEAQVVYSGSPVVAEDDEEGDDDADQKNEEEQQQQQQQKQEMEPVMDDDIKVKAPSPFVDKSKNKKRDRELNSSLDLDNNAEKEHDKISPKKGQKVTEGDAIKTPSSSSSGELYAALIEKKIFYVGTDREKIEQEVKDHVLPMLEQNGLGMEDSSEFYTIKTVPSGWKELLRNAGKEPVPNNLKQLKYEKIWVQW